jgi:hypothetical protein
MFAPLPGIAILAAMVAFAYFAEKYYDRTVRRFMMAKLKARATRRPDESQETSAIAAE